MATSSTAQTIPGSPPTLSISLFQNPKHQPPPRLCPQPLLQFPELLVGNFRTHFDSVFYFLPVTAFQTFTGQGRLPLPLLLGISMWTQPKSVCLQ